MTSTKTLSALKKELGACTLCQDKDLIAEARPCFQLHHQAKILIASQAPGRIAHTTGRTFYDPSGDRLRAWMGINEARFYDQTKIAIMPMAFCYPGKASYGDLPPVPLCADTWHPHLLPKLAGVKLTLLVGQYSQKHYLGKKRKKTLTETVRHWRNYLDEDGMLPLPHPSPLNNIWLKKNPWFETEVLPSLKNVVSKLTR